MSEYIKLRLIKHTIYQLEYYQYSMEEIYSVIYNINQVYNTVCDRAKFNVSHDQHLIDMMQQWIIAQCKLHIYINEYRKSPNKSIEYKLPEEHNDPLGIRQAYDTRETTIKSIGEYVTHKNGLVYVF